MEFVTSYRRDKEVDKTIRMLIRDNVVQKIPIYGNFLY